MLRFSKFSGGSIEDMITRAQHIVGGIALETRVVMSIQITSNAFGSEQPIPSKYTGDGKDVSPALSWDGVPEGTRELALITDDPDAPRPEPFVHWVIYQIPADAAGLPEGISHGSK